jgi:ADP-heptose:LPS heptosyltransferase
MAVGEARALHKASGKAVLVIGAHGRPMWSEVFEGNPYILKRYPGRPFVRLINGGGVRPYIELKTPERWYWRPYQPKPGELFFTPDELAFAEPYRGMVMVEPNVKQLGHTNKAWIPSRWQELVDTLPLPWVQCVQPGGQPLDELVRCVETPTFRHACAVLSVCEAFVGTDGGLMHAAAAVGVPAVILWSEFTSPDICGYKTMVNLRHAGKPCGWRTNCKECRIAMDKISVAEVVAALKGVLK